VTFIFRFVCCQLTPANFWLLTLVDFAVALITLATPGEVTGW